MQEFVKLREEDKAKFSKEIEVQAIKLSVKAIQPFLSKFLSFLSKNAKPQTIDDDKGHIIVQKIIPLNIKEDEFTDELKSFIEENNCEITQSVIKRSYMDYTYNEVLRELIPADIDIPQGYETVGQIAHFNLKPEQFKYKYLIGKVLLDRVKHIRTVVNKTEKLHNVFRTPTLELLAGINDFSACVPEGNCKFHLDFERVYWCTRLYSERSRVLEFIQPKQVILDLFCGIGPFSIRAAALRRGWCVANDLNPECAKFLKKNIIENKVQKQILPLNMDAREVVRLYYKGKEELVKHGITQEFQVFDHVYMNLPVLAMDFLDVFRGFRRLAQHWPIDKQLPLIHVYGFIRGVSDQELKQLAEVRIKGLLPHFKKEDILSFHIVKNVTASKKMVCITFRLGELDAALTQLEIDELIQKDNQKIQQVEEDVDLDQDEENNENVEPQKVKKVKQNQVIQ